MRDSGSFLVILLLFGMLGYMLRRWFLIPEAPFRRWFNAKFGPFAAKATRMFLYAFLAIWIILWATADPDDRTQPTLNLNDYIKSMLPGETGKATPGTSTAPLEASPNSPQIN